MKPNNKSNGLLAVRAAAALLGCAALGAGAAVAEESTAPNVDLEPTATPSMPLDAYGFGTNSLSQIVDVDQLRDVSPNDFAYNALRSLVERYGCISGFPDGTFRGQQPLTRFEFAAALNACLQKVEEIVAGVQPDAPDVTAEDLAILEQLSNSFQGELAALTGRVDGLEARVDAAEDAQFSTTTKLSGEVAFTVADSFGGENATVFGDGEDSDDGTQTNFTGRLRLNFITSFTGKDKLITRLTAGTTGNTFQDELSTREGRFAFDGSPGDLEVIVDRLHYNFPVGDDLTVVLMPVLGGHHFYADVFNDGLNVGGGANGAISQFNERSPIYRLGLAVGSVGVGFRYDLGNFGEVSVGYLAPGGSSPDEQAGLTDGNFSALGQLVITPFEDGDLRLGFTYVRNLDLGGRGLFVQTGTDLANFDNDADDGLSTEAGVPIDGLFDNAVSSDTFGFQTQWDVTPTVSLRGWFSFTDAEFFGADDADASILNWAAIIAVKDIGKKGSLASLSFGAEPYVTNLEVEGDDVDFSDDLPFRLEANFKYPILKNITITPGAIVLFSPNQNSDNDTIVIGALRTTFTF